MRQEEVIIRPKGEGNMKSTEWRPLGSWLAAKFVFHGSSVSGNISALIITTSKEFSLFQDNISIFLLSRSFIFLNT